MREDIIKNTPPEYSNLYEGKLLNLNNIMNLLFNIYFIYLRWLFFLKKKN